MAQIEISSLFITHSAMNNTSESIYFGVAMICLPLSTAADQPLIAYRVADELGLGFRLNPTKKLDTIHLSKCIVNILNDDDSYKERCRKYNGILNSVNLIQESLIY